MVRDATRSGEKGSVIYRWIPRRVGAKPGKAAAAPTSLERKLQDRKASDAKCKDSCDSPSKFEPGQNKQ